MTNKLLKKQNPCWIKLKIKEIYQDCNTFEQSENNFEYIESLGVFVQDYIDKPMMSDIQNSHILKCVKESDHEDIFKISQGTIENKRDTFQIIIQSTQWKTIEFYADTSINFFGEVFYNESSIEYGLCLITDDKCTLKNFIVIEPMDTITVSKLIASKYIKSKNTRNDYKFDENGLQEIDKEESATKKGTIAHHIFALVMDTNKIKYPYDFLSSENDKSNLLDSVFALFKKDKTKKNYDDYKKILKKCLDFRIEIIEENPWDKISVAPNDFYDYCKTGSIQKTQKFKMTNIRKNTIKMEQDIINNSLPVRDQKNYFGLRAKPDMRVLCDLETDGKIKKNFNMPIEFKTGQKVEKDLQQVNLYLLMLNPEKPHKTALRYSMLWYYKDISLEYFYLQVDTAKIIESIIARNKIIIDKNKYRLSSNSQEDRSSLNLSLNQLSSYNHHDIDVIPQNNTSIYEKLCEKNSPSNNLCFKPVNQRNNLGNLCSLAINSLWKKDQMYEALNDVDIGKRDDNRFYKNFSQEIPRKNSDGNPNQNLGLKHQKSQDFNGMSKDYIEKTIVSIGEDEEMFTSIKSDKIDSNEVIPIDDNSNFTGDEMQNEENIIKKDSNKKNSFIEEKGNNDFHKIEYSNEMSQGDSNTLKLIWEGYSALPQQDFMTSITEEKVSHQNKQWKDTYFTFNPLLQENSNPYEATIECLKLKKNYIYKLTHANTGLEFRCQYYSTTGMIQKNTSLMEFKLFFKIDKGSYEYVRDCFGLFTDNNAFPLEDIINGWFQEIENAKNLIKSDTHFGIFN